MAQPTARVVVPLDSPFNRIFTSSSVYSRQRIPIGPQSRLIRERTQTSLAKAGSVPSAPAINQQQAHAIPIFEVPITIDLPSSVIVVESAPKAIPKSADESVQASNSNDDKTSTSDPNEQQEDVLAGTLDYAVNEGTKEQGTAESPAGSSPSTTMEAPPSNDTVESEESSATTEQTNTPEILALSAESSHAAPPEPARAESQTEDASTSASASAESASNATNVTNEDKVIATEFSTPSISPQPVTFPPDVAEPKPYRRNKNRDKRKESKSRAKQEAHLAKVLAEKVVHAPEMPTTDEEGFVEGEQNDEAEALSADIVVEVESNAATSGEEASLPTQNLSSEEAKIEDVVPGAFPQDTEPKKREGIDKSAASDLIAEKRAFSDVSAATVASGEDTISVAVSNSKDDEGTASNVAAVIGDVDEEGNDVERNVVEAQSGEWNGAMEAQAESGHVETEPQVAGESAEEEVKYVEKIRPEFKERPAEEKASEGEESAEKKKLAESPVVVSPPPEVSVEKEDVKVEEVAIVESAIVPECNSTAKVPQSGGELPEEAEAPITTPPIVETGKKKSSSHGIRESHHKRRAAHREHRHSDNDRPHQHRSSRVSGYKPPVPDAVPITKDTYVSSRGLVRGHRSDKGKDRAKGDVEIRKSPSRSKRHSRHDSATDEVERTKDRGDRGRRRARRHSESKVKGVAETEPVESWPIRRSTTENTDKERKERPRRAKSGEQGAPLMVRPRLNIFRAIRISFTTSW